MRKWVKQGQFELKVKSLTPHDQVDVSLYGIKCRRLDDDVDLCVWLCSHAASPGHSQRLSLLPTRHMRALSFKCASTSTSTVQHTHTHTHWSLIPSSSNGMSKTPSFDLGFPTCSSIKLETQGESELLIK